MIFLKEKSKIVRIIKTFTILRKNRLSQKIPRLKKKTAKSNGSNKEQFASAKDILGLAREAKEIFMSSKLDEKQQLLRCIFSNLTLKTEKIDVELREPFNLLAKSQDQHLWRSLINKIRKGEMQHSITLSSIQTAFSLLKLLKN